jgi:predicted TIM-barrel fold metal-dependent hydrolase
VTTSPRYVIVSADTHAGAALLDYRAYLTRDLHEEFDTWAAGFDDRWSEIDTEQEDTDDPNLRVGVASFMSPYNWDSELRRSHLDSQGIAAEVIYPNTVPPFYPSGVIGAPGPTTPEEYRRRWAGVRAHNRWLVDFCSALPGRRAGLAQVFLYDVGDAIVEVRWARAAGLAGILLPSDHHRLLVNLFEPRLDRFWAACVEEGLPVHRHTIVVGDAETPESGPQAPALGLYEAQYFIQRSLGQLVLGGVFERHPELQFVMTELPTTWVPAELHSLDEWYRNGTRRGSLTYPFTHRAMERLSMLPSEYFRRNCHIARSLMTSGDVEGRHVVGLDRIMWGLDYPHHEGTWPHTDIALRLNFSGVPEDEVRTMTSRNAATLYGLDLSFLQSVADEIGPGVDDVARPVPPGQIPRNTMCPTFVDAELRLADVPAGRA